MGEGRTAEQLFFGVKKEEQRSFYGEGRTAEQF